MDRSENPRHLDRQYSWVALVLCAVAGATDAAGYLLVGHVYTSHMSGNSIDIGVHLATGGTIDALRHVAPIVPFFLAVLAGLWFAAYLQRRRADHIFAYVAAVEILLLATFFAAAHPAQMWMLIFPAAAMGVQNAMLRSVGHYNIRTTYITGMITNCAQGIVEGNWRDASFYGGICACFIAGGISGAELEVHVQRNALVAPIGVLLGLMIADIATPLASHAKSAKSSAAVSDAPPRRR